MDLAAFTSHVISWNITKRCNLECDHCYIDAGPIKDKKELDGELTTAECFQVIDQIVEVNANALLILTGGEPFLRPDVFEIAKHAGQRGLWVVVGTNGVLISEKLLDRVEAASIKGLSLSLDALSAEKHDWFRRVKGAFDNTVQGARLLADRDIPYIIQTTVARHNAADLEAIAEFAHQLGARVFNVYFLVATGRGSYVTDVSPDEYEAIMQRLYHLQKTYRGRMLVNSKCAPHYQRVLYQNEPQSDMLKAYGSGAGGCPAGTHYCGIRPNGDMTPCPYIPEYGGNLRDKSFADIWNDSDVFRTIRDRSQLGGRCGGCEFAEVCGGCRARSLGSKHDLMAEDPWCVYEPGSLGEVNLPRPAVTYGAAVASSITWTPAAKQRLERIPSFVRGMVVQRVETYASERNASIITVEMMNEIREKMGGRMGGVPSFIKRFRADN